MRGGGQLPSEETLDLHLALEKLSPVDRELLLLHDGYGYTAEELASLYNCRADCIRQRVCRARHRLRRLLGLE